MPPDDITTDQLIDEAKRDYDELPADDIMPAPVTEEGVFFDILVTDNDGNPIYSE